MDSRKGCGKKEGGFTLIELIMVAIIIGVLAAIAFPTYFHYLNSARVSVSVSLVKAMGTEMEAYLIENGKYPDTIDFSDFTDQNGNSVLVALDLDVVQSKVFSWDSYLVTGNTYSIQAKAIDTDHTVLTLTNKGVKK
jgi:prepilin-type N-terminal cleavage/methylation domain-containing protein